MCNICINLFCLFAETMYQPTGMFIFLKMGINWWSKDYGLIIWPESWRTDQERFI